MTPSRLPLLAALFAAWLAVGCSGLAGTYPNDTTIIPDATIAVSPSNSFTLEQLAYSAAGAAVLYYVFDPLAPNWTMAETKLAEDTYRVYLKMKRFHIGGDGEALLVLKRRAAQLQAEQGFTDYQIVDFEAGIESSTPIAQRFSQGVIRLVRAPVR